MTILTRVTGKVFGENAPLLECGVFGSAKAGSGINSTDVATIQSGAAYLLGWGSGIVSSQNFPPMEEVTGVLKTISYQACYSLQCGVPIYDANTEYGVGDIYKEVNGERVKFYVAIRDASIGDHTPNIGKQGDDTFWKPAIIGDSDIGIPRFSLKMTGNLPDGFIDLNGGEVSRTGDFATLFSIYGTTYGVGDGSTTFNLPDFTDCYFCGGTSAGYVQPKLPNPNLSTVANGTHAHDRGTMDIWGDFAVRHCRNNTSNSGISTVSAGTNAFNTYSNEGPTIESAITYNNTKTRADIVTFLASDAWTGETSYDGSHTHTIKVGNSIYTGTANEVKPKGIKLRVYTRYK